MQAVEIYKHMILVRHALVLYAVIIQVIYNGTKGSEHVYGARLFGWVFHFSVCVVNRYFRSIRLCGSMVFVALVHLRLGHWGGWGAFKHGHPGAPHCVNPDLGKPGLVCPCMHLLSDLAALIKAC